MVFVGRNGHAGADSFERKGEKIQIQELGTGKGWINHETISENSDPVSGQGKNERFLEVKTRAKYEVLIRNLW